MYQRVRAQLGGTQGAPKRRPPSAAAPAAKAPQPLPPVADDGEQLIESLANWKWSS